MLGPAFGPGLAFSGAGVAVEPVSDRRAPTIDSLGTNAVISTGVQTLSASDVRAVSAGAVARWGTIVLVEDDSARAQRRGAKGVSDRADRVLIRLHCIGPKGAFIAAEQSYVPGSSRNGASLRADLALELIDDFAPVGSVVVCGPQYGTNARFLEGLTDRCLNAVVEIRPTSIVDLARSRNGRNSFKASELLGEGTWRNLSVGVAGRVGLTVSYSAARIGVASISPGQRGVMFAALTGGIDGVHPGTVFGLSLDPEAALTDLLQAVGWVRWIRPIVRRKEREAHSARAPSPDIVPVSSNGKPTRLRANIKLSLLHDAEALAIRPKPNHRTSSGMLGKGRSSLNVVELFAGAGGMGLGFLLARKRPDGPSYRLVYAGEVDPIFVKTLQMNHSALSARVRSSRSVVPEESTPVDLRSPKALAEVAERATGCGGADVVIGGPPCQGFSNANRNSWHSDNPHNQLVGVFMSYVEKLAPKAFLLENVQGIHWTASQRTGGSGRSVLDEISDRMTKAGYHVFAQLLDAVWYGVPQYRSRFFVLGIHRDLGYNPSDFDARGPFPAPSHGPGTNRPYTTVRDAIADLPKVCNGSAEQEMPYDEPRLISNEYLSFLRSNAASGIITDHVTSRHAEYVIERYKKIPPGGNWESISELLTNYADVARTHSNIYRRLVWEEPSITIGHYRKSMLVHPAQHRGLSLREATRLQSFPDWFRFAGNASDASGGLVHKQQQLANAVCPLVTKAIAEQMLEL